jgi:hypothetical protein
MKKILILLLSIYGVLGAQTALDPDIASAINTACCGGSTSSIIYVDSVSSNAVGDSLIVYKNGTRYAYKYPSGGGSTYTLPIATTSILGGVKDGSGVLIKPDGTINAEIQTFAQNGSNFLVFTRDTSGTGKIDTFKWVAPDFWRSSVAIPVNANGMPDGTNDTIEFIQHRNDIFIGGADGLVRAGQGSGNVATNTVFGKNAMQNTTVGGNNTAIGFNAGVYVGNNATSIYNTLIGVGAGQWGRTATFQYNTYIGGNAGNGGGNLGGTSNVGIGFNSLSQANSCSNNLGIGNFSMTNLTTGTHNVGVGPSSMYLSNNAVANTAIGRESLARTSATGNVGIGHLAGANITTGGFNTIIGSGNGSFAGTAIGLTTGSDNIAIGNTNPIGSASQNILMGNYSSFKLTGNLNTIIGFQSGTITNGTNNVILGSWSYAPSTGNNWGSDAFAVNNNTFIGADINKNVAAQVQIGDNNSALGYGANLRISGLTNSTAIGANSVISASNQIQLGNSAVTQVRTFGAVVFQQTYTDASVPNNSMYVDATTGKLFFKDASGVANPLY